MSYTTVQNIPTRNDSDQVWLSWYKDLRKTLDPKKANSLFNLNWSNQNAGTSDANTTYLREEMAKYGIEISGGVFGESLDFGRKITGAVTDMLSVSKFIGIGVGVVVLGSVVYIVYSFVNNSGFRDSTVTLASRGVIKK